MITTSKWYMITCLDIRNRLLSSKFSGIVSRTDLPRLRHEVATYCCHSENELDSHDYQWLLLAPMLFITVTLHITGPSLERPKPVSTECQAATINS